MSTKYKIRSQDKLHFVTFTIVQWVDVFSRQQYRDVFLESMRFCQQHKGLEVYAWCIMSNHVHLIVGTQGRYPLEGILRDLKKFTSRQIIQRIGENELESRRDWMLWIFKSAGNRNPNNDEYQFWMQGSHPIELSSNELILQRLNYLHQNPVRAGIVSRPEDYLYSSAIGYTGGKGLVDILLIG